MINILFTEDQAAHRLTFQANGHAMTAAKGADLVCAAVSALTATLLEYAASLAEIEAELPEKTEKPVIEAGDGTARIDLTLSPEGFFLGRIAFHVIRTGLCNLAARYPAAVRLCSKDESMDHFLPNWDLQIFAEGAEPIASAPETGASAGAAAGPQTGDKAAAEQVAAPAAGEQNAASREAAFEALIRGEYKELYTRRVSEAVKGRLHKAEETAARLREAEPVLQALAAHYGVEAGDAAGLLAAMEHDRQQKEGMAGNDRRMAGERALRWQREAAALGEKYPGFRLARELQNPFFRAMLRGGLPMRLAFEASHLEELVRGAVRQSAREAKAAAVADLLARGRRPGENGIAPRAAATHPADVSRLSRAERESLIRRASKGEKIRF